MSRVRPAGRPPSVAKTLTLDITRKLFNHIFKTAIPIGTTDYYHLIPLSLTLTLPGPQTVGLLNHMLNLFCHNLLVC